MTVAQLKEKGMPVQPLDELADYVVAGIREERFVLVFDMSGPAETLRGRVDKLAALENPTEVHQLGA